MKLNSLVKITKRTQKRIGRGHGSGKGKTGGRGTKGQKARGKVKVGFEGGQLALLKRLPLRRGKGRNKSFTKRPIIINTKFINLLPKESIIDKETLIKVGLIDKKVAQNQTIKILGDGNITNPYTVKLPCSKKAQAKIEKAGGKVVNE